MGQLVSCRAPGNILHCNVRESSVLRPACCGVTPWLSLLSISSPESLSNGQHFRRDVRPRQARGFRPSRRKCRPSFTTLVCRSKLDAASPAVVTMCPDALCRDSCDFVEQDGYAMCEIEAPHAEREGCGVSTITAISVWIATTDDTIAEDNRHRWSIVAASPQATKCRCGRSPHDSKGRSR